MHAPGLARALKWIGGIASARNVPRFATRTSRAWFESRRALDAGSPRVLLWADTFNNFFHPEVAQAAVEVLEDAGFQVMIQPERLCCGRPLYDYGMLDLAVRKLRQILDELREEISRGTPVVGLEPSCVATFRDELCELFPHDEDAKRLRDQTYLLAEFPLERAKGWKPPRLPRKAIVHGHCHQKSVLGFDDEKKLLDQIGIEAEVLDAGCCGMAGSFGYEKEKYEVSQACGERALLPAVRKADQATLVIADGFSCQEQIEQNTDRKGVHLAQAIQMALREGSKGPQKAPPESGYTELRTDGARGIPR